MLILDAVNCTGAFSFGLCPTISLRNIGSVFIQGINQDHLDGSNGAGKSSFLNVIKEIIFERNDTGKSGAQITNRHKDWKNGHFNILWVTDRVGRKWRILSLRKWRGIPPDASIESNPSDILMSGNQYVGSDLFLERWDGTKWVDERATSIGNKTIRGTRDKIINDVVGMTYEQFSAYVCLGQQAESALVGGTSGEREKIIQAVTDVSLWDHAIELIRSLIGTQELQGAKITAEIGGLQSAISTISRPTPEDIQEISKSLEVHKFQYSGMEKTAGELMATVTLLQSQYNDVAKKLEGIDQELDILEAERKHSYERLNLHKDPPRPYEMDQLDHEITILESHINKNQMLVNQYRGLGIGNCSLCGQVITQEHLSHEIKRLEDEISGSKELINSKQSQYSKLMVGLEEQVREARKLAKDQHQYEISCLDESRNKLLKQMEESQNIKGKIQESTANVRGIQHIMEEKLGTIKSIERQLSMLQHNCQEYDKLSKLYQDAVIKNTEVTNEIEHLRWVERHLKKVKLTEYETSIDNLNTLLGNELYRMWGSGLSARLVTAQDKATGGIKQGLDLLVSTPNKQDIPIEMYSGGERKVIIIAMFKAMVKLAGERGRRVNLVAIDELDKDLDDANADRLADVFESIINDVESSIMISHNSRLLNTMKFDNVWTIRKTNEISTIEVQE